MRFPETEVWNNFVCKIVIKILHYFGYNEFTYVVFSIFYGLGYKYSFGCIRFQEKKESLYMEFLPWYFGNKNKVKDKSHNRLMLYGARDYLKMIEFFERNGINLLITSHSNKEIAFLIHRKLGFKFKKFTNLKNAKDSNLNNFELYIFVEELVDYKQKIKEYISILENFENRI